MRVRHQFRKKYSVEELFEIHFQNEGLGTDTLTFLVDLVHVFRPKKNPKNSVVSIHELLDFLTKNPDYCFLFQNYFKSIIKKNKFSRLLSDAAIINDNHFISEFKSRLFDKFLPYQPEKDTLQFVLNQVFYLSTDAFWIQKIPYSEMVALLEFLNFKDIFEKVTAESALSEVTVALQLLAQRMSGRSMENDVIKMVPEYTNLESPFLELEKELYLVDASIRNNPIHYLNSSDLVLKQIILLHTQCNAYIDQAFLNSSKYGISITVNQSLLRIRQQLARFEEVLSILIINKPTDKIENSIVLFLKLVKYNCYKSNVTKLFLESTQLVSYEITQHTAKSGRNYATDGKKEYLKMFRAAIGGGIIVGFLCFFKLLLSKVEASAFNHAFLYSFNYAFGFIIIYLFGYTLATKQPAMTAATIAQTLDEGMKSKTDKTDKHNSFAVLYASIFRTQFIAFVGNVIIAFPVALLIIWLAQYATGVNLATSKAPKIIADLNPFTSLALLHAGIAGVFLFLSGIISGSVSNRNKHYQVAYRIQENPFLKQTFGVQKTKNMSLWVEKNWAGVISNMWFGVFLGSMGSIGYFLGLNLDIRHITFASGNFAIGLFGANFEISYLTLFISLFGIIAIGFINFIVSFTLSLLLAIRSRNIPLTELYLLNKSIWNYFKKSPMHFFIPLQEKR